MTAKERVLALYPNAVCEDTYAKPERFRIALLVDDWGELSRTGATRAEAWRRTARAVAHATPVTPSPVEPCR